MEMLKIKGAKNVLVWLIESGLLKHVSFESEYYGSQGATGNSIVSQPNIEGLIFPNVHMTEIGTGYLPFIDFNFDGIKTFSTYSQITSDEPFDEIEQFFENLVAVNIITQEYYSNLKSEFFNNVSLHFNKTNHLLEIDLGSTIFFEFEQIETIKEIIAKTLNYDIINLDGGTFELIYENIKIFELENLVNFENSENTTYEIIQSRNSIRVNPDIIITLFNW